MAPDLEYRSLRRERPEIRLLDLHPATGLDRPLQCTLRHAPLESAEYRALSYVWGDQEKDRSVLDITYKTRKGRLKALLHRDRSCNLYRTTIGSSLATALRQLRRKNEHVSLWVDALCINQDDKQEQSWQVSLMTRIYSKARTVHAWLGPRYDDGPEIVEGIRGAFDFIQPFSRTVENVVSNENAWLKHCFTTAHATRDNLKVDAGQLDTWAKLSDALRRSIEARGKKDLFVTAFKALSHLPYFSRIWILQETGRARNLMFHYADRKAGYKSIFLSLCLAKALDQSRKTSVPRSLSENLDTRFLTCLVARTTCNGGNARRLQEVLEMVYLSQSQIHQATNPRDRIYALLGLSSEPQGIKVDYDLSVEEVYMSTTRWLFKQGFTDTIVTFKPYGPVGQSQTRKTDASSREPSADGSSKIVLPSWAYDWTTKGSPSFVKFRACGNTVPNVRDINSPGVLSLTGVTLGRITTVGRTFSDLALSAGLSKTTVRSGVLRKHPPSAKEKQALQASFWQWWNTWVISLTDFAHASDPPNRKTYENVKELLFRNAPDTSTDQAQFQRLAAARSPDELIDPQFWSKVIRYDKSNHETIEGSLDMLSAAAVLVESLFRSGWGMRPTEIQGSIGALVPETAGPGDEVVILHGVKAPLVLRKEKDSADAYKVIGPSHVCGVMQGELMKSGAKSQKYCLI
jgi:hypothetical protein